MASDLQRYGDETVLTTREVAEWLGCSVKSVLRMPLQPLPWPTRERRFLAGDVKALFLRRGRPPRLHR